jgi:magnesium/cobalt transport protein CorA
VTTALLFDRDAVEEIDDWGDRIPRLGRSSVLWIDLERSSEREVADLGERLGLSGESERRLADTGADAPQFGDYENYVHVTAYAPSSDRELVRVDCLVSKHWVVTVHDSPLEVLETFRERASGSGETGRLEGLELLADLLEWVLESYFDAFEQIELVLEEIDATSMAPGEVQSKDDVLSRLVDVRREIGRLRRALTSHRETLLALTRPELEAIASSKSAERFSSLRTRLDEAVQAARDSRESVVGSFDVLIASTGQRTNDIMKVLTLASVLILPGTLLAGVMGMNFKLGLFRDPLYFWIVVAAMVAIALLTLAIARIRDWI